MAPEPEVLKRKRSRPSDWWANGSIIASTPQQLPPPPTRDEPAPSPAKKRGNRSAAKLVGRVIQDAPTAGNRGKDVRSRGTRGEKYDNGGEDELTAKRPVRRGKSSATSVELRSNVGPSKDVQISQTSKNKLNRPAAAQVEQLDKVLRDQQGPKRRGRPTTAQVEAQTATAAEQSTNQTMTKKSGRPSVSKAKEAIEVEAPTAELRNLRRGRSSNTEAELQAIGQESEPDMAGPKKRGRHPAIEKVVKDVDEMAFEAHDGPKKRGRRIMEAATQEDAEAPVVAGHSKKRSRRSDVDLSIGDPAFWSLDDEPERGRLRTRRSNANAVEPELTAPRPPTDEGIGRRRTRLSDAQSQQEPASSTMKNRGEKGHSQPQGRIENTTVEVETASSKLTKGRSGPKKLGRPALSKPTKVQDPGKTNKRPQPSTSRKEQMQEVSTQARRKSSKRTSAPEPPARKRKEKENYDNTPNKRRRLDKEARHDEDDIQEPEEAPMLYQHLKPVTRKVSLQRIDAKWDPLPPACVERISQLLQDIQRPVVVRLSDERKKIQASTALQMISRRLVSKISKGLPFPQATRNHREDDFDFEKILDHNRALEAQLTPALHGNELLEAELAKETARLEADKDKLAELEANAKREAAARSQVTRKLHALLHSDKSPLEVEAVKDDIGTKESEQQQFLPLDLLIQKDENLQGVMKGFFGHVDTIQGNMKQVGGISNAIVRSKASVQATLFDHLSNTQYDEVILGSD